MEELRKDELGRLTDSELQAELSLCRSTLAGYSYQHHPGYCAHWGRRLTSALVELARRDAQQTSLPF